MTESRIQNNKWSIGHCYPSHKWLGPGTYVEKCCLSEGIHVLTCKTARHRTDWSDNVVMILSHRFCEDFVGYEELTPINITGLYECWQIIIMKISKDYESFTTTYHKFTYIVL